MLARVIASLLCLVGAAAITLGVASATAWRASDTLVASAQAAEGSTMIVTDPGVLATAADEVAIEAVAAPGDTVVLAIGRTPDVEAWVGPDAHTVVTGLSDWTTLAVRDVPASADPETPDAETPDAESPDPETDAESPDPGATEPDGTADDGATDDEGADNGATDGAADDAAADEGAADEGAADEPETAAPDPAGSDLWIEETTGARLATLDWTRQEGRWSLLVASTGEDPAPPTLTLTWPREVTTPWLWPGVIGGVVLLLAGATWWVLLIVTARRSAATGRRGDGRRGAPDRSSGPGGPSSPDRVAGPAPDGTTDAVGVPVVPDAGGAPAPDVGRPGEPAQQPAEAPLTRRRLRELEQQRRRRGRGTGSAPDAPTEVITAVPTPADERPTSGVPGAAGADVTTTQDVARPWSPAWRATVSGATGRGTTDGDGSGLADAGDGSSPADAGDGDPRGPSVRGPVVSGPDARGAGPQEAASEGGRSQGSGNEVRDAADAADAAERPQRWGERIAEHVPHLGRRARRAAEQQAEASTSTDSPAGPASWTPSEPARPTTPAADPTAGDDAPARSTHEARSASADAWRRAWGFPAAGESPDSETGNTGTDTGAAARTDDSDEPAEGPGTDGGRR